MISLTRADGTPVASFGTGVPFSNSQPQINPGAISELPQFGAEDAPQISDTGMFSHIGSSASSQGAPTGALSQPGLIEPSTRASTSANQVTSTLGQVGSSTGMGYVDPTKGHGIRGGGFKGAATPTGGKQLTTDEDWDTKGIAGEGLQKLGPVAQRLGKRLLGLDEDEQPATRNGSFAAGRYSSTPGGMADDAEAL